MFRVAPLWGLALVLLATAMPGLAQSAGSKEGGATNAAKPAADSFGRDTPRGTVSGLISAMAERDYSRAGRYFEAKADAKQLAQELQSVLDAGGTIDPFAALSNEPQGNLEDGLATGSERIGNLSDPKKTPILLSRGKSAGGGEVWRVSQQTSVVARQLHQHRDPTSIDRSLEVGGASVIDWLTLLGIAALVFLGFQAVNAAILFAMGRAMQDREKSRVYRVAYAAMPPLSLLCATLVFQVWAGSMPVSIIARQAMLRYLGIFAWVALAWFLARMIDAIARLAIGRMEGLQRRQTVSVISLARRGAKLLLLFVAAVAILDTFGIDVTTGIAALGIGGIALALGAQKTVENFVGSITLIADKPVQVGDFCKVGDVLGTVEDVGIRSTRIRTLDRTVVTIPNGDFSARQIENFARRDHFLFNPLIRLEYGIGSAKLLQTVEMVESILANHERIMRPGARARLKELGVSSIDIETFSYIQAADFDESLIIRQDLLLTIFSKLEEAGVAIAYPTQTLQLKSRHRRDDAERTQLASADGEP